jgi:hypothetical protein
MLNLVKTAPTALPVWLVELQVELPGSGRPSLNDDDVEPMVELMYRTEGVRSVAIVPLQSGLAVALGLAMPNATAALERARGLTACGARYARLGEVAVRQARVTLAPAPARPEVGDARDGDHSAIEARRAIREDCWGLLFYASAPAFDRPFIRHIELPAALEAKRADSNYTLFAVPRGISYESLRRKSLARWGEDLSAYHSGSVKDGSLADLEQLANQVLLKFVGTRLRPNTGPVRVQLSTRDLMPDAPGDLLRIDLTAELATAPGNRAAWDQLLAGLRAGQVGGRLSCGETSDCHPWVEAPDGCAVGRQGLRCLRPRGAHRRRRVVLRWVVET